MRSSGIIWGIIVLAVLVAGIWWIYSSAQAPVATTPTPTPTATDTQAITPPTFILSTATSSSLGTYLASIDGMTLYTFKNDSAASSTCYGSCATKWPALTTSTTAELASNDATVGGRIATITRADGTTQVTYNDQPLYFYYLDKKTGDTKGNGVGNVWFAAKP